MPHSTRFVAVIGLIALAAWAPPAGAEIGVLHETSTAPVRAVRSAPQGAQIAPNPDQVPDFPQQQFGGGILWVDTNHQAAVAQNLAISGDGAHIVAGWWLNNARVALYATDGNGVPGWTFPIASSFFIPVDASNDGGVITGTGRQDLLYSWNAASNVPVCLEAHPGGEGVAAFTPDAGGQFAGSSSIQGQASFTHAHTSPACGDLFTAPMASGIVDGRYAADGAWVAVNSRSAINVYNSQTGAVRGTIPIPGETEATAGISHDGEVVAIGGFSHVIRVYRWNGSAYVEIWNHDIPLVTWITAVDVSDDGSTVMVGTWFTSMAGELGRVFMYDVVTGPTPLWSNSDFGDYVDSVELSADGGRGIAGSWGRAGGTFGHIVAVFDRANPIPFFAVGDDEIPEVGSCHAVSIANDGLRAGAGGKAVHAREFGNGGYVIALDLGGAVPVEVADFAARPLADCAVELEWQSSLANGQATFRIYRGAGESSGGDDEVLLTNELVTPAETDGGRSIYRFVDRTSECGRSYVYELALIGENDHEVRVASILVNADAPASAQLAPMVLGQNQPNPFLGATEIPYALAEPLRVRLSIFDAGGRMVRAVDLGMRGAGTHVAPWDGRDGASHRVPSGVYFYRIEAAGADARPLADTRRLVVME